jgi:hypothetical protein
VRERRKQLLLVAVVAALGVVIYQVWPRTAASGLPASNVRGAARTPGGEASITAPDVHLEALDQERPKPGAVERNLFRFKPKPAPVVPSAPAAPSRPVAVAPSGPPPPPPIPPIALKFIGLLEAPDLGRRVAVLSDSRGVYHGREGDIIEGRYRILRIGTESIEMAYADGRGRQTIRLSGQ